MRARFLLESLADLQRSLRGIGSDLVVLSGRPREAIPGLMDGTRCSSYVIYAQKEVCV